MTDGQKDRIRQMRADGCGYIKIAQELGISENIVKSFCRRKGLNGTAMAADMAVPSADGEGICPCCGAEVKQNPGRKANYEFVCACCKKPFTAYGNAGRKYCCHACYVADRFGGGADE